jgi:NADH:ubiquinone oxidoreductase subunit C
MTEKLHVYVDSIKQSNQSWITEVIDAFGEVTVVVPREAISDVCGFLKESHQFDLLADLTWA